MKLVTFRSDEYVSLGAIKGDVVYDVFVCAQFAPQEDFLLLLEADNMLELAENGQAGVEAAAAAVAGAEAALREPCDPMAFSLEEVDLLAPLMPRKLFCLAGNYAEHIQEGGGNYPGKEKMTPRFFMKPATTTVTVPDDPIIITRQCQCIDWEIEMGVVIGKEAKCVSAAEADDCILGYTLVTDVSERKLKVSDARETRDWDDFFDWLNGKWLDSFAPMGPCIVTKDEIGDPLNLRITLSVNGEPKQDGNTGQMIFTPAELIEFISQYVTLEPGDVISTGTPAGVGSSTGTFLKDGDEVVGELEKVGRLANPVYYVD